MRSFEFNEVFFFASFLLAAIPYRLLYVFVLEYQVAYLIMLVKVFYKLITYILLVKYNPITRFKKGGSKVGAEVDPA